MGESTIGDRVDFTQAQAGEPAMSVNLDRLVFADISLKEVPVTINGEDYVLREANGEVACKYRNYILKCTKLNSEGKPSSIDGFADAEPYLVSMCLFKVADKGHKPVPLQLIKSWPSYIQKALHTKAKEISSLNEVEEDTQDTLVEKIDKLKEQLAALNGKGKEGKVLTAEEKEEQDLKNLLNSTTDG